VLAPDDERLRAAERDAARADLGRLIAACYYEPAAEFAEERLFDSMAAAAARVDPELAALARRLGEAFAASSLRDLLVDYAQLFLGPGQARAQPYASVWLSGENRLMLDSTVDVLRLYEQAGFAVDATFHELPDHVAAELEFLYLLIHRDNEARWRGDEQSRAAALLRGFVEGHLGRWLGAFLLAMHDAAKTGFYETLAELTEAFVRGEGRRLAPAAEG
jgi:TorA maturation chaperone TorD